MQINIHIQHEKAIFLLQTKNQLPPRLQTRGRVKTFNMKKLVFPIILILIMAACVTPYMPNVTRYESILVVDAQLTNLTGPYKVKLSRTYRYDGRTGEQVTGASVKIIDNDGLEVPLNEISTGVYSNVDTTFHGVPGKSYKLQIKVNTEVYESDFETIKAPVPIDKFYWEYKPMDGDGPNRVELMLDTQDPTNKTRFYGWEYDETWKFIVPIDVAKKPEWKICYRDYSSFFITLGNTIDRNNDRIDRHNIISINESTNRLFIRYTILAKQYSLSEDTYKYLKEITKLNLNQGSLFDPIPYSLMSNVKCISNKVIPVVGYFIVAGASEKRIFIDRSDLPKEFIPTDGFKDCSPAMVLVDASLKNYSLNLELDSLMRQGYAIYDSMRTVMCRDKPRSGFPCITIPAIQMTLAKPHCFNCTVIGDNVVPAFWTEKK